MGKYRSLISNTLIFAIGSFSSRLLVFILMPLLTYLLSPAELGSVKNAITTCNLILPVMYLCISEGVIRFGLESHYKRSDIFTVGILTVLGGYLVFLCMTPLLNQWEFIQGYEWLVKLYVLTSASRTVVTHFVRAGGLVRIFALDGMITSITTISLVFVFLLVFKLGTTGYMLATICADAISAIGLIIFLKLHRFFKIRGLRIDTAKDMLKYSIPLVPTAVFWWVTNLSDRFFVTAICGSTINGQYDISSTLPSIIMIVSAIFIQAWQISAFSEHHGKEAERFYSTVFKSYYTLIFLAASGILLFIRPVTMFMFEEQYHESWRYSLFLVLGISFSCLVTFLGTVYNAAKKNTMVTVTTAIGAALNLLLNWILIPVFDAMGAAAATFISFFVVFIIRAVDTRRYIKISMQPLRIVMNLALLLIQVWIGLSDLKYGTLMQVAVFIMLVICNIRYVALFVGKFHELAMSALSGIRKRRAYTNENR